MSGQSWKLTVYMDPERHDGLASIATFWRAGSIEAARRKAERDANGRGPYTLEPVCPLCDGLIEIGAPLHLESGPDHAAEIYTHPACARARRAARS